MVMICMFKAKFDNFIFCPWQYPGRPPMINGRDFKAHIAENVAKGSSLCPFGSKSVKDVLGMNSKSPGEQVQELTDLDLHGFDPEAPDSDDEPLSDLE